MTATEYVGHITDVMVSLFGLAGARNSPMGNALIRGVSGGERKRVSIAESFMSLAPVQRPKLWWKKLWAGSSTFLSNSDQIHL